MVDSVQGLELYSRGELKELILDYVHEALACSGLSDIDLLGIEFYGSRTRNEGLEDSDLDVVIEYCGDLCEDDFFQLLHVFEEEEEGLSIEGISVDIRPITEGTSGTLDEFLAKPHITNYHARKETSLDSQVAEAAEQLECEEILEGARKQQKDLVLQK